MAGPGGAEAGRLSIRVLPNTAGFAPSLQRYLDRIESRARVQVSAVPDLAGFRQRLTTQLSRVRGRVKVTVDPDLSTFRDTLRGRLQGADAALGVRLEAGEAEIARLRSELADIDPPLSVPVRADLDDDVVRQLTGDLADVAQTSDGANGSLAALAGTTARLATMASAIPAVAGLAGGIASLAPAAGVAVPAMLALASAKATVSLGMSGVTEAFQGQAGALEKLAPAARDFVGQAKALAPAWTQVKQSVQGALFANLGDTLTRTAGSVLPVLRRELTGTAGALNLMAEDVADTASGLASSGALGQALGGATSGLRNLSMFPAVIAQGLVQVGAAAAPAFGRLTAAGGGALEALSERMATAFQSGAMEAGIARAITSASLFLTFGKNVSATLGNIFTPAMQSGAGFLGVLSELAATAARVTATPEAQSTFTALFGTLSAVGQAVGGVLGAALTAALPLLHVLVSTLAGPVQQALGVLSPAFQGLAASLGSALGPVVETVSRALAAVLPVAAQLAAQLAGALGPALATVGAVLGQIGSALLTALPPAVIAQIGAAFGDVLKATEPLVQALGGLLSEALRALLPVVSAGIKVVAKIATVLASLASKTVTGVVVPALTMIVKLLQGDFRGALDAARTLLGNLSSAVSGAFSRIRALVGSGVSAVIGFFRDMGSQAWAAVRSMGVNIASAALSAMKTLSARIASGVSTAVGFVRGLPGKAREAVGSVGSVLASAGRKLIQGFIDGIKGMIGSVKSTLGDLTSKLTSWKGPPKRDARLLVPAGRLLIQGFIKGINGSTGDLRRRLESLTKALPKYARTGVEKGLRQSTARLSGLVGERDRVLKRLATANKTLADLRERHRDVYRSVRDGILSSAAITRAGEPDAAVTVASITDRLKTDLKAAKKFAEDLATLRARGLSDGLLEQIAEAGVDGGAAHAAALARASKAQIAELNKNQKELEKHAGAAGKITADALHAAGIASAEGLVKGLKARESALEAQMVRIAKLMLDAFQSSLKIAELPKLVAKIGKKKGGKAAGASKTAGLRRRLAPATAGAFSAALAPVEWSRGPGRDATARTAPGGGVRIEHFHAGGMTPGQMARDLEWRMKARG